jgi:hypothetical protein
MAMSLSGLFLGLINVAIVVAVLVLVGLIVVWLGGLLGVAIPQQIQRVYLIIVFLVGLYMVVALLFGLPTLRILGG